jgi:hypothetical protein
MNERWTTDYSDTDLTFFMLVYEDYDLAELCFADLRTHYPHARVVVRSDGDSDPRFEALASRYAAEFRRERRLFTIENGGAVIERMFEIYSERPTPYLFKIDPDTIVQRRFRFVPARSGYFGTLQGAAGYVSVQGGCLGFTSDAAATFFESGLLRDPRLAHPQAHRESEMYWEKMARRVDKVGLSSFDWILGWAATKLGVEMFEFPEVRSQWKIPVEDPYRQFAVVHPRAIGNR